MKIERVELLHVAIPLVSPFRTSFGTMTTKDTFLLRVVTDAAEGWSEFAADPEPLYCSEFVGAAELVLEHHLVPRVTPEVTAAEVAHRTEAVKGHKLAKAALETAILDAELRSFGMPLGTFLGATTALVPAGVSVGIKNSIPELLSDVEGYLAEGYARIKLKIEPGWDVEPVRAVRERFGDILLQVDANTAYTLADAEHLRRLDEFGLLLIEQPLDEDDIRGHSAARATDPHADLPRRVDHLGQGRGDGHRARRVPDDQRQARAGRRVPGGAPDPRRRGGARDSGVVRRNAGDRHRARAEPRAGRVARFRAARRRVGVRAATSPRT